LFILIIVRSINEVPAGSDEGIEDFKGSLLGSFAHVIFQSITKAHGTQTERGDAHTSSGSQLSVSGKGGGRRWRSSDRHVFRILSCHYLELE
jgi:hypothetical protein